jgi:two-component system, chemotaxis family, CheB/CheR fusion protein
VTETSATATELSINPEPAQFPIVGVGASAGGLESLEKLFRALPARTGAAFVIIQHLSPDFKSLMDELMARFTDLTIHRAAPGVKAEPDHVYLLQPGKELEIRDGAFDLFDRDPRVGLTESLENVDERRRRQYFVARSDGRYQVVPQLRHAVVFARHDLLKDAPFTQLDLVSCRNLLIYFRPAAQKHALSLLPYGLRVGGALLLGPSEAPGEIASEFESLNEPCRIYVKRRLTRRPPVLSMTKPVASAQRARQLPVDTPLLSLYDAVLDHVMPPSVLVDADRNVIDSFAGAERLLRVRRRRASADVLDLVPDGARLALAAALTRAARDRAGVRFEGIEWAQPDGDPLSVDLRVDPLEGDGKPRAFLISILSQAKSAGPQPVSAHVVMGELSADRFTTLEQELKQSRETLQSTLEQLESSSEEMQATNEELVASNEELQSTNEELHSVNEELHTVNAELQSKIHELSELNHDMRLLFQNIEVAIVFLDSQLRIRRFTPRAAALFGLMEHDQGRALTSFQHPFKRASLMADIAACRDSGQPCEYEVTDHHGDTHLVRINSYAGRDQTFGVVLSITDLTALAAARKRVELLSSIVESTGDAIIGLDQQQRITAWNPAAVRLYGFSEPEALGLAFGQLLPADARGEFNAAFESAVDRCGCQPGDSPAASGWHPNCGRRDFVRGARPARNRHRCLPDRSRHSRTQAP